VGGGGPPPPAGGGGAPPANQIMLIQSPNPPHYPDCVTPI
jgi:hypothetical protein